MFKQVRFTIVTLLALLAFGVGQAFAGVEVDGVYYIFDEGARTATVTYSGPNVPAAAGENSGYSGDVVVPGSVYYGGYEYTVTTIGEGAFKFAVINSLVVEEGLTTIAGSSFNNATIAVSMTLPSTVTTISGAGDNGAKSSCPVIYIGSLEKGSKLTAVNGSFMYSAAVTDVYMYGTKPATTVGAYAFSNAPKFHVPSTALDQYTSCSWKNDGWGRARTFVGDIEVPMTYDDFLGAIAVYTAKGLKAGANPNCYPEGSLDDYEAALSAALALTESATDAEMKAAVAAVKAAYNAIAATPNALTEGYYYMVNNYEAYKAKFGVYPAIYTAPRFVRSSGASACLYDKFDENNANFIYKLTAKEGKDGYFYAQNAASGWYLNTGDGGTWYGEVTTCSEEPTNAQWFRAYGEGSGEYWVADETDDRVGRALQGAASLAQRNYVFGWSQFTDGIPAEKGYNTWTLIPVSEEKVTELVAATAAEAQAKAEAIAGYDNDIYAKATAVNDAIAAGEAPYSEMSEDAINAFKNAYNAAKSAIATEKYNESIPAATIANALNALPEAYKNILAATPVQLTAGDYYIVNAGPDFQNAQGKDAAMRIEGANVKWAIWDKTALDQVFTVTPAEDGTFYLKNKATGTYVGTTAEDNTYSKPVFASEEPYGAVVIYDTHYTTNGDVAIHAPNNSWDWHPEGNAGGAGTGGNIVGWPAYLSAVSTWKFVALTDADYAAIAQKNVTNELKALVNEASATLSSAVSATQGAQLTTADPNNLSSNATSLDLAKLVNGTLAETTETWSKYPSSDAYIQVDLGENTVKDFYLSVAPRTGGYYLQDTPKSWIVEGSNDGSAWNYITEMATEQDKIAEGQLYTYPIINAGAAYKYMRFTSTVACTNRTGHTTHFALGEFQLNAAEVGEMSEAATTFAGQLAAARALVSSNTATAESIAALQAAVEEYKESLIPSEFVVEGIKYLVNDDKTSVTVTYNEEYYPTTEGSNSYTGAITIPATVSYADMDFDVTAIGNYAFAYSTITSVEMPESVTTIGNYAFNATKSLSEITIPDGVTTIGRDGIAGSAATKATLGASVATLAQGVFYSTFLTDITFRGLTPPAHGNYEFSGNPVAHVTAEAYAEFAAWDLVGNSWGVKEVVVDVERADYTRSELDSYIAALEAKTYETGDGIGYSDAQAVEALNAAIAEAKNVADDADAATTLAAIQTLSAAAAAAQPKEITEGYYYIVTAGRGSGYPASSEEKYNYENKAAVYNGVTKSGDNGLYLGWKTFDPTSLAQAYHFTKAEDGGWYCQSVADGTYIGKGTASYSCNVTVTENAEFSQKFISVKPGKFAITWTGNSYVWAQSASHNGSAAESGMISIWGTAAEAGQCGMNLWYIKPVSEDLLEELVSGGYYDIAEETSAPAAGQYVIKNVSQNNYFTANGIENTVSPIKATGIWTLEATGEGETYYLKSEGLGKYIAKEDWAAAPDGYDGYDIHGYKGLNASLTEDKAEAVVVTITATESGYSLTTSYDGKNLKLAQQRGTDATFEPSNYTDPSEWVFYAAPYVKDIDKELALATQIYDFSAEDSEVGTKPGLYSAEKVAAYNSAKEAAQAITAESAKQAKRDAIDNLEAAYNAAKEVNPIVAGYYYIVSAGRGSGYPFSDAVNYDDEEKVALYNEGGFVNWKMYDESLIEEVYEFTADENGNWYAKNIIDNSYINKGTGTYSCKITTTNAATTAQVFEPSVVTGKWTAKPAGNPYVYALTASHNGSKGEMTGTLNIWGSADEANKGKMNLWYLIPATDEAVEAAYEAAAAKVDALIAEFETMDIPTGTAPGTTKAEAVEEFKTLVAEKKAAIEGASIDEKLAALSEIQTAYETCVATVNPLTDGRYYIMIDNAKIAETGSSTKAMTIAQTTDGAKVVAWAEMVEYDEAFAFDVTDNGDGTFTLQNVKTGLYTGIATAFCGTVPTSETASPVTVYNYAGTGSYYIKGYDPAASTQWTYCPKGNAAGNAAGPNVVWAYNGEGTAGGNIPHAEWTWRFEAFTPATGGVWEIAEETSAPEAGKSYAIKNVTKANYATDHGVQASVNKLTGDGVWTLEATGNTVDDQPTYYLYNASQQAYWQNDDFEGNPGLDGYDIHGYAGTNAYWTTDKAQAMEVTIMAAAAGSGNWRTEGAGSEGYILALNRVVPNGEESYYFKLGQQGVDLAMEPWNEDVAWTFYEATFNDDIRAELAAAMEAYGQFAPADSEIGTKPGLYNADNVAAYTAAKEAANAITEESTNGEIRKAIDALTAAYSNATDVNPIVAGYYYIVSAGKGSGYPFSDAVNFDEEERFALYNEGGFVNWKMFDESIAEEIYEFTADANGNWMVKSLIDNSYINRGTGSYSCKITTSTDATTAQVFEPSVVIGKWTAKFDGNPYVYALTASHNGSKDAQTGTLNIWGTAAEANQGKMNLWYLIPVSEEAIEAAKEQMAAGLEQLIADIEAENLQSSDAPGYYTAENIEALNATLAAAKTASTADDKIAAMASVKAAYAKATTEFNPITDGYYYLINKYAAYETQFGAPAAMYVAPADLRESGLANVRFEKFDETNPHFIFQLTAKEGVEGGFYAYSVMDSLYLNTGDGASWYGEVTTASTEALNAQIFKNYRLGMFWVADETDTNVSRVVRTTGVQNGTVYGWTTIGDNIAEAQQWYNAWELRPVPAEAIAGIEDAIAAKQAVEEAAAPVRADLREYAIANQDKIKALIADESDLDADKKAALKAAWNTVVAAVNAKNYDITGTAETIAAAKTALEEALAAAEEGEVDYWQIAEQPSAPEAGKYYVLKNAYNNLYLTQNGGTTSKVNQLFNAEVWTIEQIGEMSNATPTYALKSMLEDEGEDYWQYVDFASQSWDENTAYDGYDWYDYAGLNAAFGAKETAQEFTILPGVAQEADDARNSVGGGKEPKGYVITAKDKIVCGTQNSYYKLGVQGTNAALEPYNEDVAWFFYEVTPVEDPAGALAMAIEAYGNKEMKGGNAPGYYAQDAVNAYNTAVSAAKGIDPQTASADEMRAATEELIDAAAGEIDVNPIVEGYYFIVTAGKGPGYNNGPYDREEQAAMYNDGGFVKWGPYDDQTTKYVYYLSENTDNGSWMCKNIADNSYIEKGTALYGQKVSASNGAAVGQEFIWTSEGKYAMKSVEDTYVYSMKANHNGSDDAMGDLSIWGTAAEAANYGVNVWFLIPCSEEMIEKITAVDGVAAEETSAPKAIYTIGGQKVSAPQKGEIYVIDGKAVKY